MSEWKEIEIGSLTYSYAGGTPSRAKSEYFGGSIPWISSSEVNQSYISEVAERITEKGLKYSSAKWVPPGSVLVAMYGATAGQIAYLRIRATTNQAVLALIPRESEIDSEFLYYQTKFNKDKILYHAQGSGQPNLNKRIIDRTSLLVPPLPVQRKIARILSTIDGQIEKTEAIIAKYQAIKQGMLQDLFTRGIDVRTCQLRPRYEDAPDLYKESALGMIPKEWEVKKLKDISEFITSGSRGWASYYAEEGALFIRIGNLTREHINFRFGDTKRVKLPENDEGKRTLLKAYDVLISITADLGIIGVIPDDFEEAYINQHIALVRMNRQSINPRFVGHFLAGETSQKRITMLNDSGAKAGLNLPAVANLLFISPELDEQNRSAELLNQQDATIVTNKKNLAKLQLLKQGLMQDLLSGKVEVEA